MEKFNIRDLFAIPFWASAQILDWIAVCIGGKWTSEMFIQQSKKISKIIK